MDILAESWPSLYKGRTITDRNFWQNEQGLHGDLLWVDLQPRKATSYLWGKLWAVCRQINYRIKKRFVSRKRKKIDESRSTSLIKSLDSRPLERSLRFPIQFKSCRLNFTDFSNSLLYSKLVTSIWLERLWCVNRLPVFRRPISVYKSNFLLNFLSFV